MPTQYWLEIGKNGDVRNMTGRWGVRVVTEWRQNPESRKTFPVAYNIQWDLVCPLTQRFIDGLEHINNIGKHFKLVDSQALPGQEMHVLISKWELKGRKRRNQLKKMAMGHIGLPFLDIIAERIVAELYHFWHVRVTLTKKQMEHCGWDLLRSEEVENKGDELVISWGDISRDLRLHFRKWHGYDWSREQGG